MELMDISLERLMYSSYGDLLPLPVVRPCMYEDLQYGLRSSKAEMGWNGMGSTKPWASPSHEAIFSTAVALVASWNSTLLPRCPISRYTAQHSTWLWSMTVPSALLLASFTGSPTSSPHAGASYRLADRPGPVIPTPNNPAQR